MERVTSVRDEQAHESHPRAADDLHVPAIFLSHSGKQKAFVENLYNSLQSANHTAFFDKHSLPKGSSFPPHINRAAHGCQLGVVVLSHDFLTSRWPMLELEMLVLQRGPDAAVLPLFYKLSPRDLKSPENLSEWRQAWKEKSPEHASQWEQAVQALASFNGEVFTPGTSEAAYIKRVVRLICNLLPSPISYDLSLIKGHQRLAQVVARQFEEAARQCDTVCVVGLHGVGGLGKTTMCKIMANFFNLKYLGKSYLLEFPSDGDDKKIVQESKKALKTLANLSDEHLLNKVDSFDQVAQLMGENFRRHDVFLAIDNIWESSLEFVKRILGVGFSANSRILLTSRSEQVLKDLLNSHINMHVGPLPCPDLEEAFQIFQETFSLGDLNSLVSRKQLVDDVLKRCFFSGSYHPLALKALGRHVKRVCALERLENIEHCLSVLLQEIRSRYLQNVEDLIMLNYVNLPEIRKHMFLDIAVVMQHAALGWYHNFEFTYRLAHQWLGFLYKEYSKNDIADLIYELALDGLIQLERHGRSKIIIRVHDLYSTLAQREAASSSRFLTCGSTSSMEGNIVERVLLGPGSSARNFVRKLHRQKYQKLQVLYGAGIDFWREIYLDLMPSLCVLKLVRGSLGGIKNWSAANGLAIVHLSNLYCAPPLERIPSIPCVEEITIENVNSLEGPPHLHGCQNLRKLALAEESVFKGGEEYWDASYFNSVTNLERLQIQHLSSNITKVLNLNALVKLQSLHIERCALLEGIEGLDALTNLQHLDVQQCPCLSNLDGLSGLLQLENIHVKNADLKEIPDLSGLTCLQRLVLLENNSLGEVGDLSPSLKYVDVGACRALKKMPDLRGLTRLEHLELKGNTSMEEVIGGLSPALKYVDVRNCVALKKLPDLRGLTCLETLELHDNHSMEEVIGGLSPALKYVDVSNCVALKKLPDLRGLTCLELLELCDNHSMEEVMGGLSPALVYVRVSACEALKKMPDLSDMTCLEELYLTDNTSMEEVGGELFTPTLKYVKVQGCDALKKMPNLSGLTCLEWLQLIGNTALEEVVGLGQIISPNSLREVHVAKCGALRRMPDLSGLTCLRKLWVYENESMEEVGGENLSCTLEELRVYRCRSLRRFPSVRECVNLQSLAADVWLIDGGTGNVMEKLANLKELHLEGEWTRIERVISYSSTHLKHLTIQECSDSGVKYVDGGCLPSTLKYLEVRQCKELEEVGDLSALHSLETLFLRDCPNLKKLGGFCIPPLQHLWLHFCESLQESGLPNVSAIPDVDIARFIKGHPSI